MINRSWSRLLLLMVMVFAMSACTSENYANGERIGLVTQFSKAGIWWKSWEGHLNLTQTGMNSSSAVPFDFSIDNDAEDPKVIALIDSAANLGWKVKLTYHQTFNKNWLGNRGETSHFITNVQVLDRNVTGVHNGSQSNTVPRDGDFGNVSTQGLVLSCQVVQRDTTRK